MTSQNKTYTNGGKVLFDKLSREKIKKGYKEVSFIDTSSSDTISKRDIKTIAKTQISYTNSKIKDLIEYLADKNMHNIISNTNLKYNTATGMYHTPLGIVTKSNIDRARILLSDISDYVKSKSYKNKTFISGLEEYLTLIPQDIGMKFIPENIFPDNNSIIKQSDILDSLESSYKIAITPSDKNDNNQVNIFNTKIDFLEDKKEFDRINKKYEDTKKSFHSSNTLKIKEIYMIEISKLKNSFDNAKGNIGNIKELWHGSTISNCLSILKDGLRISPPSTASVTGKLFGNGIYFSDISSKSLNYSFGYWNGSKNNECFMFLSDVALGKYYVPSYGQSKLPKGYDSFWAKPNASGIQNNEMIIFNESQHNLKYLIKFSNK